MEPALSAKPTETDDQVTAEQDSKQPHGRSLLGRLIRRGRSFARRTLLVLVVCSLLAQPAAAQAENPVCQDSSDTLANMIEGFLQITTGLGLMGLLVVWQAESLLEMFTLERDRQTQFKRHKRSAGKSAVVLIALGPLFAVAGSAMELPIAQCVDLIPF